MNSLSIHLEALTKRSKDQNQEVINKNLGKVNIAKIHYIFQIWNQQRYFNNQTTFRYLTAICFCYLARPDCFGKSYHPAVCAPINCDQFAFVNYEGYEQRKWIADSLAQ